MEEVWELIRDNNRPYGELAMTAYLDAPPPTKTGVTMLDHLLGGGMTNGVTVIGGESSAGKSVLACQCAAMMAARGTKVVYASYEMSWEVVQLRCASSWSGHGINDIQPFSWASVVNGNEKGKHPEYSGKDRFALSQYLVGSYADPVTYALTMWDEHAGRNLAVITSHDTIGDLLHTMRMIRDERPVLIVDYIQIVPSGAKGEESEYSRVTSVMNQLQEYSMEEGSGNVIAISSTKRLSQADRTDGPSMDWFRGSGYVGYAAEQAVILTTDYENVKAGREISRNADGSVNGHITVVKNKSGASGMSVPYRLYGQNNLILRSAE